MVAVAIHSIANNNVFSPCCLTGEVLVLGDSIPKYLGEDFGFKNGCLRGATIAKIIDHLTFMVQSDRDTFNCQKIILHIGTNNIKPGCTAENYMRGYTSLLSTVEYYFPTAQIFCSSVIPRPCDWYKTKFITQLLNELTCILAAKRNHVYIPAYKRFIKNGSVDLTLYSSQDRLHLNGSGLQELADCFRQHTKSCKPEAFRQATQLRAAKVTKKLVSRGYPKLP